MNNTIGKSNNPIYDDKKIKIKSRRESTESAPEAGSKTPRGSEAVVSNEARASKNSGTRLKENEVESLLKNIAGKLSETSMNLNDLFNVKPASVFALLKENQA